MLKIKTILITILSIGILVLPAIFILKKAVKQNKPSLDVTTLSPVAQGVLAIQETHFPSEVKEGPKFVVKEKDQDGKPKSYTVENENKKVSSNISSLQSLKSKVFISLDLVSPVFAESANVVVPDSFFLNPPEITIPSQYDQSLSFVKNGYALFITPKDISTTQAEAIENKLIYSEVRPQTDLVLQARPNGVKENIILKEKGATQTFSWDVKVSDNLEVRKNEKDGRLGFFMKEAPDEGKVILQPEGEAFWLKQKVFEIPAPYMVDAKGNKSTQIDIEINDGILTFIPNKEFLEKATYPVLIDPTIIHDTQAEFDAGTKSRVESTSAPELQVKNDAVNVSVDNADTVENWLSNDYTNYTPSQETTDKQEGTGSIKIVTTAFDYGNGSDGALNVTSGTTTISGNKQYTSLNVSLGAILALTADTGSTIRVQGTVTISGTLDGNGKGRPGGAAWANGSTPAGQDGGGYAGTTGSTYVCSGGGGGGYGSSGRTGGTIGDDSTAAAGGRGGKEYGDNLISTLFLGSGGGGGAYGAGYPPGVPGGAGGGAVKIIAQEIHISGTIQMNGANGGNGSYFQGGGGGGSGGTIWISSPNINISGTLTATGGSGGGGGTACTGGNTGGDGRIRVDYGTLTNTGTINPTAKFNDLSPYGLKDYTLIDFGENNTKDLSNSDSVKLKVKSNTTGTYLKFALGENSGFDYGNGSDGSLNVTSGTTTISGNKQYTSLNVSLGATLALTADTTSIIQVNGTVTISGTLDGNGKGRPGGTGGLWGAVGATNGSTPSSQDGGGYAGNAIANCGCTGGGGGGNYGGQANFGVTGGDGNGTAAGGHAGREYGDPKISTFFLGSGGGGGGSRNDAAWGGAGGAGGGAVKIIAKEIHITGTIQMNGANGTNGTAIYASGGGGGSGGSIWLIAPNINTSGTLTATGGSAGGGGTWAANGGSGGNGRIRLDYESLAQSGTITPTPLYQNTNPIDLSELTFDITVDSANTWETKTIDISSLSSTQKDAIRYLAVKNNSQDATVTFYFDDIKATSYYSYGTYTSSILDLDGVESLDALRWAEYLPTSTDIEFQTRTANQSNMSDAEDWKPLASTTIDNGDTVGNWTTSDSTNYTLSQETTIKQEGTGSLKVVAVGQTSKVLDNADTVANWTTSDAPNFAPSQDTNSRKEGTGSIKIVAAITNSLNDTLTRDLGAGGTKDLSSDTQVKFWVFSTRAGTYLQFGMGESAWNNNTTNITINTANAWEEKTWDISGIATGSRDAIRYLGFKCTDATAAFNFWFDDIRSYKTPVALNDYIQRDLGAGGTLDLSSTTKISFWIRSSVARANYLKLGISEDASTWSEYEGILIDTANTWQQEFWDISTIAAASRNAIRYIRLTATDTPSDFTLYLDDIKASNFLTDKHTWGNISSAPTRYFQYRAILNSSSSSTSSLSSITLIYSSLPVPFLCLIDDSSHPTSLTIKWTDTSNNETQFRVEKSTNSGAFGLLTNANVNSTSYLDTDVASGNTYQYRVRTENAGGNGDWCTTAAVDLSKGNLYFK